ncbi:putative TIM-barrel fold metal-dependent hydrolase [Bradyrhizobium elkanii]
MTGIVDGHHHIWRQADLAWLSGPMQPRIFGPYEPIRRDYPIEEYLDDLKGTGVTRSVYVQTNWPNGQFEDEAAWVQQTADAHGWPHALVAYADFSVADVRPHLDRLKRYPLVRGVRMQLHWHENPLYRFAARADLCTDPVIRRNVGHLADYSWSFDLQVFAPQMADAAGLAEACPDVTFILQHAGMLEDLSPRGPRRLAHRDDAARAMSECGVEAVRARHLHPSQRCRAYRRRDDRYRRDLRRRPLPVRLELSDREAVDQLSRSRRRFQDGSRTAQPRTARGDLQHDGGAGLSAGAIAAPRART